MKYRIYFNDGSYYDGDTKYPDESPCEGIQVIVMKNPDGGIMTCAGSDYYVIDQREGDDEPRWYGMNDAGLQQYLRNKGYVKFGWHIGNRAYRAILDDALKMEF